MSDAKAKAEHREQLRRQLRGMLKGIPDRARNGTYQEAVDFKEWFKKASRLVNSPTPSPASLSTTVNEYSRFQ